MSDRKTQIVLGGYRLVRYDRLNWGLEEYRAPDPNNHQTRSPEPKWMPTGHYFSRIGAGVSWLLEHEMLEDGGEYDLAGAVARFEQIATDLRSHVDAATEGL